MNTEKDRHCSDQRPIKIGYTDMWNGFDPDRYGLTQILSQAFPIEISDRPDYLFFSVFGDDHLDTEAHRKVFVTHEAAYPDFRFCDFALSFYWPLESERHIYYPNFLHYTSWEGLERLNQSHNNLQDDPLKHKPNFCAFVVSNGNSKTRNRIFEELSGYRQVMSGGAFANNIGFTLPRSNTISFFQSCKFVISAENSISPGYVTEKILQAMLAGSVPIYWGDSFAKQIFNEKRFIDVRSAASMKDLIARVAQVDADDDQYLDMLSQPVFKDGHIPTKIARPTVLRFFQRMFSGELDAYPKPNLSVDETAQLSGLHRRWVQGPRGPQEDRISRELRAERRSAGLMD